MKNNIRNDKGVTMMILIIYVIALTFIIGILSIVSSNFFSNTKEITNDAQYIIEYNKFAAIFVEDAKSNSTVSSISNSSLVFNDGTTYVYDKTTESIFRNDVKVVSNISYCKFTKDTVTDSRDMLDLDRYTLTKNVINVDLDIHDDKIYSTKCRFVLKYW